MTFLFGETQRVPQTKGLIGVNGQKMVALLREEYRRPISAQLQANSVASETGEGLLFRSWRNIPNANAAIVTCGKQRPALRCEGQAGNGFPMPSQVGRTSGFNIHEADDLARVPSDTHGQSAAIGRERQHRHCARLIGHLKGLSPVGRVPKPYAFIVTARSQRFAIRREDESANDIMMSY